jgi:hypothetical protein
MRSNSMAAAPNSHRNTFHCVVRIGAWLGIVACAIVSGLLAAQGQTEPARRDIRPTPLVGTKQRARPPVWSADAKDAFFIDARTMLVGPRPDYSAVAGDVRGKSPAPNSGGTPAAQPPAPTAASWSKLIDAEAIETEIKRAAQSVATNVTAPGPFKGGGYKACRRDFSLLAVLFAVTGEYDSAARWQDVAPGLREAFARAGRNAKVGTDATYNEATARKRDLEELIRGARPEVPSAEKAAAWGQLADRPPLMQRLNAAQQERLTKWLANEKEFASHADDVRHEAQIVALLADVIGREGFEYWDDAEYANYARELREAVGELAAAVKLKNYDQGRKALDRATKACANCHDGYRG